MRKLFLLFFVLCCSAASAYSRSDTLTLLLIHPTVKNVSSIKFLIEQKICPINLPYKIIGVYHKLEIYEYKKTINYVKKENITNVSFYCINKPLSADSVFCKNSISSDFEWLFQISDGAIFTGGPDIPPALYNAKTLIATQIEDPFRHYMEISFLAHLLGSTRNKVFEPLLLKNKQYALLGICLGMQSMNVAAGGSLIQDIPSQIYNLNTVDDVLLMPAEKIHANYHEKMMPIEDIFWGILHPITFCGNNKNFIKYKTQHVYVVSAHHQCIGQLAEGYETIAFSTDLKIPEMIAHKQYPNILGVQFHPEVVDLYLAGQALKPAIDTSQQFIFAKDYAGEKGLQFHYDLWKMFGIMLEQSWKNKQ